MPTLTKEFIGYVFTSQDPGKKKVAHSADFIEGILMKGEMACRDTLRVKKTHRDGETAT